MYHSLQCRFILQWLIAVLIRLPISLRCPERDFLSKLNFVKICVFSPKPGSAASRTFHKIPLKFLGRRRYKYLILLCNNIEALYHFFILNILICFILYILYFAERKIYNHCNTMEIEMTEIARGEKASKQPSLAVKTTQQTHGN